MPIFIKIFQYAIQRINTQTTQNEKVNVDNIWHVTSTKIPEKKEKRIKGK